MMMKQEALNVAYGHAVVLPLAAGTSSGSFVTSTLSGRPPLQSMLSQHGGGNGKARCALSRLDDPHATSLDTSGQSIYLNRTPTTGLSTPAGLNKQRLISAADMPPPANPFNRITGELLRRPRW
jgi:hypothetical protein